MKVRIDDITDVGCRFNKGVPYSRFDGMLTEEGTGYRASEPVQVDARLHRAGSRIVIEGSLVTGVRSPCKRCLREVEQTLPYSFQLELLPGGQNRPEGSRVDDGDECDERDGSFSMEEADYDHYEGESIDMWLVVREQLLLALPEYTLCDEHCEGLCQTCGANLNGGDCGCNRTVVDPRLADLSKIRIN